MDAARMFEIDSNITIAAAKMVEARQHLQAAFDVIHSSPDATTDEEWALKSQLDYLLNGLMAGYIACQKAPKMMPALQK